MEETAPAAVPNEREKAGEALRLRQCFPETLYWTLDVQTDDQGQVEIDIPMADSITTWRPTALASSRGGRLGFATRRTAWLPGLLRRRRPPGLADTGG